MPTYFCVLTVIFEIRALSPGSPPFVHSRRFEQTERLALARLLRSTETILCHRPDDGALKVAPLVMSDAGTGQQFPQDRAAYGALINGSKPISRLAKAAGFDGGNITPNAGALLLGQALARDANLVR